MCMGIGPLWFLEWVYVCRGMRKPLVQTRIPHRISYRDTEVRDTEVRDTEEVPEGRQNCSPGRKPWVTNPNNQKPRRGDRNHAIARSLCRPSGAFGWEDIYPGLAPWATILSPLRGLSRRLLPSKILYRIRRVKALSLGKNRKTLD